MERKKVSGDEFLEIVNKSPNGVTSLEVDGLLETNSNGAKLSGVINNVVFNGPCRFHNSDIIGGVVFVSCVFNDTVSFNGIKAGTSINPNFAHSIAFSKCSFEMTLFIRHSDLIGGISMASTTVKELLDIKSLILREGYISVEGCTLNRISVFDVQTSRGFRFSRATVSGYCQIVDIKTKAGMQFIRNRFDGRFSIQRGSVDGITFNDGHFADAVTVNGIRNTGRLTFARDSFQGNVTINVNDEATEFDGLHRSIYIADAKFLSGVFINGHASEIESIELNCSPETKGTIRIADFRVQTALLRHDNHYANIIYKDCLFRFFTADSLSNYGNVTLSSCSAMQGIDTCLLIRDSNLGRLQLLNVNLSSFSKVQIEDSILSNIQFSGVQWFHDKSLDMQGGNLRAARYREVYRQLRMACENQYERAQVLEFRARELKWMKEEVSQRQRFWDGDRMILWLSQTNDHGQNWYKALGLLILGTLAFYILMVLAASEQLASLPAQSITDALTTLQVLVNEFHVFFELFNPTRTLRFVFEHGIRCPTLVYALDALHRIFLAFFVVQIVSAFRKFFKT